MPGSRRQALNAPAHPAPVPGRQNDHTEHDTVPGKNFVGMGGDEAYQGAHRQQGADKGGHKADREHRRITQRQHVAMLVQVVESGGKHRWNCQKQRYCRQLGI